MTFPKINSPNLRCYLRYIREIYVHEIKPQMKSIDTPFFDTTCSTRCLFFFSFFSFYREWILSFGNELEKKRERKEKKNTRTRSCISETREKFDKKGRGQSIRPFVKKKIKGKNGNRIKRIRQSIVM